MGRKKGEICLFDEFKVLTFKMGANQFFDALWNISCCFKPVNTTSDRGKYRFEMPNP